MVCRRRLQVLSSLIVLANSDVCARSDDGGIGAMRNVWGITRGGRLDGALSQHHPEVPGHDDGPLPAAEARPCPIPGTRPTLLPSPGQKPSLMPYPTDVQETNICWVWH